MLTKGIGILFCFISKAREVSNTIKHHFFNGSVFINQEFISPIGMCRDREYKSPGPTLYVSGPLYMLLTFTHGNNSFFHIWL